MGNAIRLSNIPPSPNPQVIAVRLFRAKQHDPNGGPVYGKTYYAVGDITEGAYSPTNGSADQLTYLDTKADADLGAALNPTPGTHPWSTEGTLEIWATVDDPASQALVAAALGGTDDGVIEAVIDDPTLSTYGDLIARGQAELTLFAQPQKTLKYACRDPQARKGAETSVHLTDPPIDNGAGGPLVLRIEEVTIDQVAVNGTLEPRYTVSAGPRFTMADLLHQVSLTRSSAQTPTGGSSPGTIASNAGRAGAPTTTLMTIGETPGGAVDGSNVAYTTARTFLPQSLQVFIRGLEQEPGVDFAETSGGFTMTVAPPASASGKLWVHYRG